jgi:hypothetical protein
VTSISTRHTASSIIDADRWPDVATAAGPTMRAAIARALFTAGVAKLALQVRFPTES